MKRITLRNNGNDTTIKGYKPVCSKEVGKEKTRAESCGPWLSFSATTVLRSHLILSRSFRLFLLERPWWRYPWFFVGSFPPARNRAWGLQWELHQKLSGKRFMLCKTFCIKINSTRHKPIYQHWCSNEIKSGFVWMKEMLDIKGPLTQFLSIVKIILPVYWIVNFPRII